MPGPLQIIVNAIEQETSLEIAVDKALTAFKSRNRGAAGHSLSSLKPRSGIDPLLESLVSQALKDDRFLPVFDLLAEREPGNANVYEAKAYAWAFEDSAEVVKALIQALAILEERGGIQNDLLGLYLWLGETYEKQKELKQAIAAYSMLLGYYREGVDDKKFHYQALYKRAHLYLDTNRNDLARRDVAELYRVHKKGHPLEEVARELGRRSLEGED